MKKLVSLFLALILALGLSIPAMAEGTTLSVAAIETAYGSEIWQEVTAAFTELPRQKGRSGKPARPPSPGT